MRRGVVVIDLLLRREKQQRAKAFHFPKGNSFFFPPTFLRDCCMYIKFNQFVRFPAFIFSVKFKFHYYSFLFYILCFYFGRLIRVVATRVELDSDVYDAQQYSI
jgi:hypothetical protein